MKIKSIKKIVQLFVLSFIITIIASCNNNIVNDDFETGNTTVNIFVPNYIKMANKELNARVVAPQTKSVQFSYVYEDEEIVLDKVLLSAAEENAIEDEETGLFGNTYKITFSGVYVGTYAANSMTVSLLDENDEVISKGSNAEEIKVTKEENVSASFYTIPVSVDAKSSYIVSGEMKFFKETLEPNKSYVLEVDIDETNDTYPDIVVFNEDGTYNSYLKGKKCLLFKGNEGNGAKTFYFGVYAKDKACSYSVELFDCVEDFALEIESIALEFDEEYQIKYIVEEGSKAVNVTYKSDNEKISVSDTGKIIASGTEDGYQKATITVNIDGIEKLLKVEVLKKVQSISVTNYIITQKNKTVKLEAQVLPEDATNKTIVWESSDNEICTISETGELKGIAEGTVTIKAKGGDKEAYVSVLVLSESVSITSEEDFVVTENEYITDAAGKVSYKFTKSDHAPSTKIPDGFITLDIQGKKNDEWRSTTYRNSGWGWNLNNRVVSLSEEGKISVDDLQLNVRPYLIYEKGIPYIFIVQQLTNIGTTELLNQKMGVATDVQIAGNDKAPVNVTNFGANLIDESTEMVFSLNCLSGTGITPASSLWVGEYKDGAMSNVYTDKRESLTNKDSAISFSYQNINLAPGESKLFTVKLTFIEDEGGTLKGIIY